MTTAPKKSTAAAKRGPASDEDFTYDTSVGTITVPSIAKMKKPNAWQLLELETIENPRVRNARMNMMLIELAAGKAVTLVKQLDVEEMGQFMEAWAEHSGVALGESLAS